MAPTRWATRATTGATAGAMVGLALLAGAVACGSSSPATSATRVEGASCAAILTYGGREYMGNATSYRVPAGRSLGDAAEPGCYDAMVNGTPRGSPGRQVHVLAVRGVDPQVAIVDPQRDFVVYVARGMTGQAMPAALRQVIEGG
jgi:Family of unknown function (DUF6281)